MVNSEGVQKGDIPHALDVLEETIAKFGESVGELTRKAEPVCAARIPDLAGNHNEDTLGDEVSNIQRRIYRMNADLYQSLVALKVIYETMEL